MLVHGFYIKNIKVIIQILITLKELYWIFFIMHFFPWGPLIMFHNIFFQCLKHYNRPIILFFITIFHSLTITLYLNKAWCNLSLHTESENARWCGTFKASQNIYGVRYTVTVCAGGFSTNEILMWAGLSTTVRRK